MGLPSGVTPTLNCASTTHMDRKHSTNAPLHRALQNSPAAMISTHLGHLGRATPLLAGIL